jgi:hypothetical protein
VGFVVKEHGTMDGSLCEYFGSSLCLIQALLLINRAVVRRTDIGRFTSRSSKRHTTPRIKLKCVVLIFWSS